MLCIILLPYRKEEINTLYHNITGISFSPEGTEVAFIAQIPEFTKEIHPPAHKVELIKTSLRSTYIEQITSLEAALFYWYAIVQDRAQKPIQLFKGYYLLPQNLQEYFYSENRKRGATGILPTPKRAALALKKEEGLKRSIKRARTQEPKKPESPTREPDDSDKRDKGKGRQ